MLVYSIHFNMIGTIFLTFNISAVDISNYNFDLCFQFNVYVFSSQYPHIPKHFNARRILLNAFRWMHQSWLAHLWCLKADARVGSQTLKTMTLIAHTFTFIHFTFITRSSLKLYILLHLYILHLLPRALYVQIVLQCHARWILFSIWRKKARCIGI